MPLSRYLLAWMIPLSLTGGTMLYDFETEAEVSAWTLRMPKQDQLSQDPRYASHGSFSLRFATPAYRKPMEQWPAFQAVPAVQDWRPYDRLVLDITNPHEESYFFELMISDKKVPFRSGLKFRFTLPSRGHKRFVIPLSGFPAKVDRSRISTLHFFTQRPQTAMEIFLDAMVLLKAGESPPPATPGFVHQVAQLVLGNTSDAADALEKARQTLETTDLSVEERQRGRQRLAKLQARLDTIKARMQSTNMTLADLETLKEDLAHFPRRCERLVSRLTFAHASRTQGVNHPHMLVGLASSMRKILPREMPFDVHCNRTATISLARNEEEALQVLVMPRDAALKKVFVEVVGDLHGKDATVFPASQVECCVTGYVQTRKAPPYKVSYVGWWPDPILDFLGPIDIAADDIQSFWIRFRCPRDQRAGQYHGVLRIHAAGMPPAELALEVTVHDFVLPEHTPLPTAITFFERKPQMGGKENWSTMKFVYADFLADYYIDYDSLYRHGPPDFDILEHLHREGKLVAFNLGNVFNGGIPAGHVEQAVAKTVERLRPAYDEAKRRGLLDYAYIYGFDERGKDQFPLLEQCAKALRRAFPEVLLMTTSYDHSFGLKSVVKTVDAWCPLTPRFDKKRAARARKAGKYVWWYICCSPKSPYANWFVESDAIEARLLMGAMTEKYRPDGFLYYSLSIWNKNKPIESGPFTRWNPVSWTTYHGDGSLLCSGPGGKPVPTIRLENYRDGLEDFAYACILEACLKRHGNGPRASDDWQAQAKAALDVPSSLLTDLHTYSRNPADVYRWRERMAALIEASPNHARVNPWGDHFGVRGLRAVP